MEVTRGPDPAKVMEMLAEMDPETRDEFMSEAAKRLYTPPRLRQRKAYMSPTSRHSRHVGDMWSICSQHVGSLV